MENVTRSTTTISPTNSSTQLQVQSPNSFELTQMWMGRLDLFASVFGIVFTVILGFLAFLTWINNKQKNEAADQLEQIKQMGSDIKNLHKQFNEIMGESKKLLEKANYQVNTGSGLLKEAETVLEKAKKKDIRLGGLQKKMETLSNEMTRTIPILSNASQSLPYISLNPNIQNSPLSFARPQNE